MSSSSADAPLAVPVTPSRKYALLLEARNERTKWIEQVPLPYDRQNFATATLDQDLPSATPLLRKLYGSTEILNEKIQQFALGANETADSILEREKELEQSKSTSRVLDDYHDLIQRLQRPESATTVNAIRRHLQTGMEQPTSLQSFVDSTYESFTEPKPSNKHSFEAFCFGQAHGIIQQSLIAQIPRDEECHKKLETLQFLTPKHLDLELPNAKSVLQGAVLALRDMQRYFSPYDKLQRVLESYHQVNKALNEREGDSPASADDVLPTLILVVVYAAPEHLMFNLEFIQEYGSQEYLRGEAGYAFTNLYGAVQFLLDLDETKLTIEPEVFRAKVEEIQKEMERKLAARQQKSPLEKVGPPTKPQVFEIPVSEIRQARLKGLNWTDIEWAKQFTAGQSTAEAEEAEEQDINSYTRAYSFLTSQPNDITLSDLPKLLEEYRSMAQMIEQLLAEKTKRERLIKQEALQKTQEQIADLSKQVKLELEPADSKDDDGVNIIENDEKIAEKDETDEQAKDETGEQTE